MHYTINILNRRGGPRPSGGGGSPLEAEPVMHLPSHPPKNAEGAPPQRGGAAAHWRRSRSCICPRTPPKTRKTRLPHRIRNRVRPKYPKHAINTTYRYREVLQVLEKASRIRDPSYKNSRNILNPFFKLHFSCPTDAFVCTFPYLFCHH